MNTQIKMMKRRTIKNILDCNLIYDFMISKVKSFYVVDKILSNNRAEYFKAFSTYEKALNLDSYKFSYIKKSKNRITEARQKQFALFIANFIDERNYTLFLYKYQIFNNIVNNGGHIRRHYNIRNCGCFIKCINPDVHMYKVATQLYKSFKTLLNISLNQYKTLVYKIDCDDSQFIN